MRRRSGDTSRERHAAAHELSVEFLRKNGPVDVEAVVISVAGSGLGIFLRSVVGPLGLRYRYLASSNGKFQVWARPAADGSAVGLVADIDRPVVSVSFGKWHDCATVNGRPFLVYAWQRPYLRELLEIAATPPATAMAGLPAGWYHDPWSFPKESPRLRFWNGSAWTHDVNPKPTDPT